MLNLQIFLFRKQIDSKFKIMDHIYRMYAFGKVLQEQVTIQNDSLKENQFVDLAKRPI
jgi:hypothetical protein